MIWLDQIILSASGMADAGRILHHLKHNLWRDDCCVIFAGYQAEGSMGRRLVDGAKRVKIMGEDIRVKARIVNMRGYSAHADKEQMLTWFGAMKEKPKAFMVMHGEIDAAMNFADELNRRLGTAAYVPRFGDCIEINGTEWQIHECEGLREEPAALELRAYLRGMEREYLQQRTKIEQIVARDATKITMIRKKLEKMRKYMDDILSDI